MIPRAVAIFFLSVFFCCTFSSFSYAADEEKPSLQEIAKTEAAKLFVSKQYRQALAEFQKLESQYPRNIIIKRYIASLYDSLRQWDEAVAKLNEAIALKRDDLISRQLLGDVYIKRAELDRAVAEFQMIVTKDPDSAAGKYAAKKLEDIQRLKTMPKTVQGKSMGVEEFMKSVPAQAFSKGTYQEALNGFDQLLAQYPEDMLIRRFRGIALVRLKRGEEAIKAFEEALKIEPNSVATHFYLGQTYSDLGKVEEARKELQWVIKNDEASYRARAQRALFQTLGKGPRPPQKRWSVGLTNAYDYDMNATYKSRDDNFSTAGDKNSGRYTTTASGTYRLAQKGKWTYTSDLLYAQTLYDDFPNLQTYTHGGGISALYVFTIKKKPAALNIREGAMQTFLKNKYFTWSNTLSTSLIYNPTPRLRTTLSHRWVVSEYDNNGTSPDLLSRDGFTNAVSLLGTYYINTAKTFYVNLGYDFERGDTSGANYNKNAHGARLGIHFPVIEKIECDVAYRFKDSDYDKYKSAPPKRHDDQNTITVSVSRPLNKYLTLSANYSWDDTNARNNAYEYRKNTFGVQLAYRY